MSFNNIASYSYRAAVCDIICLEAVVLPGGKTTDCIYGNGRKLASFLLTSPALVIEHLASYNTNYQKVLPLIMEALCDNCVHILYCPRMCHYFYIHFYHPKVHEL